MLRGATAETRLFFCRYFCPITIEIMEDPVIAADGHSYERAAIVEWLVNTHTRRLGSSLPPPPLSCLHTHATNKILHQEGPLV